MSMTPAEKAATPGAPYRLDAQLEADSLPILSLPLCKLRLMNNSHFPWFLLVPQVSNASEIIDLAPAQRQQLMNEISQLSEALQKIYQPAKLNVASLGNMVAQLHVHVIARFVDDAAWPKPVWGTASTPYVPDQAAAQIDAIRAILNQSHAGIA